MGLQSSIEEREDVVTLDLLDGERGAAGSQMAPVSSITFFTGKAPEKYLRERVKAIVAANPWLGGRLVKVDGVKKLVYPKANNHGDRLFRRFYKRSEIFLEVENHLNWDALVKKMALMSQDDPVFKTSLVRDYQDPDRKYAIIVSMSHNVGDGHTFYSIYKMLCQKRKVLSISPKRKQEVIKALEEKVDADALAYSKSASFIIGLLLGLVRKAIFGVSYEVGMHQINKSFIDKEKTRYKEEENREQKFQVKEGKSVPSPPFISTNDIVTSWLLRATKPKMGWMAINCRNKIKNCIDSDAGNYATILMYRPRDFASPSLIRRSVGTFRRAAKPSTVLPGTLETLRGQKIFVVTNWTTFYGDISLEGSTQELHFPFIDYSECVDTIEFGIIFKPKKDATALLYCGRPGIVEAIKKANEGILDEIFIEYHSAKSYL